MASGTASHRGVEFSISLQAMVTVPVGADCMLQRFVQSLQIMASWARLWLLQKSHFRSPTVPFAHFGQIKATVVSADCLQKSHHLSRVRPLAQRSQMMASSTILEDLLQKLQRAMIALLKGSAA
jgi:hypothetical protein